jgi:uncharacterized membrane protein
LLARDVLLVERSNLHVSRLDGVDVARGIVMVLMAVAHVRDYFFARGFSPEDLAPHLRPRCSSPASSLLAGTGGYLSLVRGKSVREISRFYWACPLAGILFLIYP